MTEHWKPVKGYEGLYEVSDLGRVRNKKGKILKTVTDNNGYKTLHLCKNSIIKCKRIHRIELEAFKPKPFESAVVDHIDGDKQNNKLANLEWVTSSENQKRAMKKGLKTRGATRVDAKLTKQQARNLKISFLNGEGTKELSEKYNISTTSVHAIIVNKKYVNDTADIPAYPREKLRLKQKILDLERRKTKPTSSMLGYKIPIYFDSEEEALEARERNVKEMKKKIIIPFPQEGD